MKGQECGGVFGEGAGSSSSQLITTFKNIFSVAVIIWKVVITSFKSRNYDFLNRNYELKSRNYDFFIFFQWH